MQKHTPSSPINVTLSKMISKWSDTEGPVTVTFIFSGLEFQKGNGVRTKLIVKTRNVTGDIFAKPALLDCFGEKVDSAIFTFYTDGLSLCELCSLTEAISSLATTEHYLPFKMTWTLAAIFVMTSTITACLLQSSQGDTHRYLVAKTKKNRFFTVEGGILDVYDVECSLFGGQDPTNGWRDRRYCPENLSPCFCVGGFEDHSCTFRLNRTIAHLKAQMWRLLLLLLKQKILRSWIPKTMM